jgi:hypothetical protein
VGAATCVGLWALLSCGGGAKSETPVPAPTLPLPTTGIAGQPVGILPLTLIAAEDTLHWMAQLGDRRAALARSDSIIGALLEARAPEVPWVLPEQMRRAAHRAAGVVSDPDQMATAILRTESITLVPDPLRSQLRTLAAVAGSGGRYVLVPAALVYRRTDGPADRPTAAAELSVVLVDVRTGQVGFRTVARGEGDDPWTALERAVKSLTPGLP